MNDFYVYLVENEQYLSSWTNQRLCAEELGIKYKNLNACLKGLQKTCKGFKFIKKVG